MGEKIDIILFGVTGFTGKHALKYLHKFASIKEKKLKWGIAGRNETKLKGLLEDLKKQSIDSKLTDIPIIIADVENPESLKNMASRAKLIINCCGPYRSIGEPVVKACIEAGTHHLDISGELTYMEKIQLEYNSKAKEKGVYIVSACGLDSIPADLGVIFLQKQFEGTLNSVETYMKYGSDDSSQSGSELNYGTWDSAVYGVSHRHELVPLRAKLFPKSLPALEPKLNMKRIPFKSPVNDEWAVVFPGADQSVMMRTQRYLYEEKNQRPVQIQTYFLIEKFYNLLILAFFGVMFSLLVRFKCGRSLLLKYPKFFTFGYFDNTEPSLEKVEKTWFNITLVGKGWKEKLSGPEDEYKNRPNKEIVVEASGRNPAYGTASICLVLAGIVILTEPSNLPKGGGVFSPGAAFGETTLIKQLNENGVKFNLVRESDISS